VSVSYRLNEFFEQCEAIRRGLATVLPYRVLPILTWQELELVTVGKPTVDVEFLKKMTSYDGVRENDPHIQLFWRMMSERFDDEQRMFACTAELAS
jgi:hypothetical protein